MRGAAARRGRAARRRTSPPARARRPAASRRARRAGPARAPAAPAAARGSAPPTRARRPRPRGSRRRSTRLLHLPELLCGARVHDVGLRQPAAPRLRNRELEIRLRADLVPVRGDDELQSCLLRGPRVDVAQVEPVRLAVDLEEGARRERALDHPPDVDGARRALRDPAAGEVADAVDIRVLHCLEHPLGRPRVGCVVHRRDDPVEQREILLRDVDLAVRADVRLDTGEDRELREPPAQRLDLLELRLEPALAQVVRVVGDGVVLVAARNRAFEHLLERALAVGRPVRVRVEVAADVAQLDELRQLTLPRRLELARVLTQLRRDRLVAEELVDRVLVGAAKDIPGLDVRDAVLRDREPTPHGVLAHRDVVVLRPGEVLEEIAERLGRNDAQVEAVAVARDDGRLRVALRRDVDDPAQAREALRQVGGVRRARDDVEVAVRLLAAAHRPRLRDVEGRGQLTQRRDGRLHRGQPRAEQVAARLRTLGLERERGEDLLLALRPKPGERPQLLPLGRRLELVERLDAELAPDARRGLRPQTRQLHEEDDLGRNPGLLLRQGLDLAELDDLDDLLLDRLADALQLFRASVERELRHRARRLAHTGGRAAIRDDAKRVLALELEEIAQQVDLIRNLRIARQLGHATDHRLRSDSAHDRLLPSSDVRRTLTSVAVALAGAAAVTAGGWSLQAAALPPPARADRVAADASAWLHDYRLVIDVFHVHHHRFKGACLRGWFPGRGRKTQASLLSLGAGPIVRVSSRWNASLKTGDRKRRLPVGLLALVGCSGKLSRVLAAAAQSGGDLGVERSYAANQPAIALTATRAHDERLTLYVSPRTHRPIVAIVERDGHAATARLYLNRVRPRTLLRFRFPPRSGRGPRR